MEQAGDKMKTMIFYESSCTKFYKKNINVKQLTPPVGRANP